MIKGVNIKCTDSEMRELLELIVTANKYQLPKDVVFIIKEDKPKFPFFGRLHKSPKMIEDKQESKNTSSTNSEENIVDVEYETVNNDTKENDSELDKEEETEQEIQDDESVVTESQEDNEDKEQELQNLKETIEQEEDEIKELKKLLKQNDGSLKSLEKAKLEMTKTIKRLQKEKDSVNEENKVLQDSRIEILTILKDNVESIRDEKLQDKIIRLYFTEVEPPEDDEE